MGKLDGKVAIVTGSTSGMGRAIAELFAREGASVIVNGRDQHRGQEVVRSIASLAGDDHALFVRADVSTPDGNQQLVAAAVQRFGRLDILVANAGMLGNGTITDLPIQTWHDTLNTNLSSIFYLMKFGIPAIRKSSGKGTILVNGSIAGSKEFPAHPAYCASKAAAVALVKQAALDYGPDIRVNIICPGQVDTPLLWKSAEAFPNPAEIVQQNIDQHLVMRRLGKPEDIAQAALFLVSDDASWITGTAMVVDGGRMLGG